MIERLRDWPAMRSEQYLRRGPSLVPHRLTYRRQTDEVGNRGIVETDHRHSLGNRNAVAQPTPSEPPRRERPTSRRSPSGRTPRMSRSAAASPLGMSMFAASINATSETPHAVVGQGVTVAGQTLSEIGLLGCFRVGPQ